MSWVAAAFVSTFFAGITSILAKCGIKQTDSDVATAIRICVALVFACAKHHRHRAEETLNDNRASSQTHDPARLLS